MFIINFCLNMFRASLCPSSGEQRQCVAAYGVLRWLCWMWLVAVVGRCVVGCEHPEDGHNDARNMLRQKLIINIWLLHLVVFLYLHTMLTMHGHRDLKQSSLFIILQVQSACFGCQPHPLSEVYKTVTTASSTGHIFCSYLPPTWLSLATLEGGSCRKYDQYWRL